MERRIVDGEITLVPYDPNYKASLPWYQDADVCKQVDNRNSVYDLKLLKAMYRYLNARGSLFYIKYRGRLCGDVCLHPDGEINIVVAKSFQNKHIGRRVIGEIQKARKGTAHPQTARGDLLVQCAVAADVRAHRIPQGRRRAVRNGIITFK